MIDNIINKLMKNVNNIIINIDNIIEKNKKNITSDNKNIKFKKYKNYNTIFLFFSYYITNNY